jgi:hydroxyacylglutathione hydrolase
MIVQNRRLYVADTRETVMGHLVENDRIRIDRLILGPFETNSYILTCRVTGESVVVDAPADADTILRHVKPTTPRYILITHTHMDHLGALTELRAELQIPVAAHPLDAGRLQSPPDMALPDSGSVSFGRIALHVLHTPGHTPGSVCFLIEKFLLSGDTIFSGGPGRTNSPGDFRQIIESIRSKIFPLPDDTRIYPGHGDSAVLGDEKAKFAAFSSRPHAPDLCGDVLWSSS